MNRGMWRYVKTLILLLSAYFACQQVQDHWRQPKPQLPEVEDIDPWRLALAYTGLQAGDTADLFLRFDCKACYQQAQDAEVTIGDATAARQDFLRFRGNTLAFHVDVPLPSQLDPLFYAWLSPRAGMARPIRHFGR